MKLSDYVVQYLVDQGVKHAFLVIGGACAHIVDSLGNNNDIEYVCFEHEQGAAMAVDVYSRVTKNVGVAVATSGPGATNLITGMCCLWFDSVPGIFITGQVNVNETKGNKKVRQIGFQETDIVDVVRPITKYAVMVTDPKTIKYHLDKAFFLTKSGRPGPVLIDIPLNVQHADIDPNSLDGFVPDPEQKDLLLLREQAKEVLHMFQNARRPVIIAGMGIKRAGAVEEFSSVAEKLGVPVVATWGAVDMLPYSHHLNFGHIGVYGNRASNFLVQNADLLLVVGSRLDTRHASGQAHTFARAAKKIVVDVDKYELEKGLVKADMPIHADAKDFLSMVSEELANVNLPDISEWKEWAQVRKARYPGVLPEYHDQKQYVNPYVFFQALYQDAYEDDIFITDTGGCLVWSVQAYEPKKGQELISAFAHSPMGYAFPAAIGAWFADPKRRIITFSGDGGFQLNIQELQTVKHYNIPLKMFVLNNNAYGIIKQFQEIYFQGKYMGTTKNSGYSAPDFVKVAEAYGIPAVRITDHEGMREKINKVLVAEGPMLCEVMIDESQKLIPKLIADRTPEGKYISKPLEDMAPFLPRDEFMGNMIIDPLPESGGKDRSSEIN